MREKRENGEIWRKMAKFGGKSGKTRKIGENSRKTAKFGGKSERMVKFAGKCGKTAKCNFLQNFILRREIPERSIIDF